MLEVMPPDMMPRVTVCRSPLFLHFARHGALPFAERMYWDLRVDPMCSHRLCRIACRTSSLPLCIDTHLISAMSTFYDLLTKITGPSHHLVQSVIELCGDHDDFQAARQLLDLLDGLKDRHGVKELKGDWIAALVWQYARIGDLKRTKCMHDSLLMRCASPPRRATEAMVRAYFSCGRG